MLRLATNAADVSNLDPHYAATTQDRTVCDMIFNGLIRFTPGDTSSFEPDIATEMPTAADNDDGTQTWSFTLRDDVLFQSGPSNDAYALTAADVVYSFEKAANPDTSAYAADYDGWTFTAVDDQHVDITIPAPVSETLFYPLVANYTTGFIICREAYEAGGSDAFLSHPVGTGPFMFESHTPQNNVTLRANDEFFRGAPKLGGVEVRFIQDTTSRELALQSGDVDVINGLKDMLWIDRMDALDGFTCDIFGVGEVAFFNLDTEHEILKDPKVREAILIAMNRENHVALAGEPVGKPVYSVVPYDLMPGGLTEEEANEAGVNPEPDLDRARELLAEAGYPVGFEMDLISSEMGGYRANSEVMVEELREIGININLEVVQHASMHEQIRQGRNPIVLYITFLPNADAYFAQFFSSAVPNTNFSKFNVDDLRAQARAETDPDAQAELWKQANIAIQENFAAKALLYLNQAYVRTDRLDYGHELKSVINLYPGIDETTTLNPE